MIKIGKVSEKQGNKVKVVYEDLSIMTPWIDVANHVTGIILGNNVVVALFDNDNYRSGIVIGVIE
jgi:hypothetical protein